MGVTNSSLFGPKEFWRWETGTIFPLVFVWSRAKYWQKGFYSVKAAFFPVLWLGGIEFFLEPFFSGSLGDIELEACAVPCTGYTEARRKCRDSLRCAFLRSKVLRSCPSLPFSEPSCACLLVVTWVFSAIRYEGLEVGGATSSVKPEVYAFKHLIFCQLIIYIVKQSWSNTSFLDISKCRSLYTYFEEKGLARMKTCHRKIKTL